MTIPYRTQRVLIRILIVLAVIAVVFAVISGCWFLWVQRYIVYTADGTVKLDFDLPPISGGQLAVPPEDANVSVRFDQNDEMVGSTELSQMLGYYVISAYPTHNLVRLNVTYDPIERQEARFSELIQRRLSL